MPNLGAILVVTPAEGFGGDSVLLQLPFGGPATFTQPGAFHQVFFVPSRQFYSSGVGGLGYRAASHSVLGPYELGVTVPPVGPGTSATTMPPDDYVLVVASGFDRAHTSNVFRAKAGGSPPSTFLSGGFVAAPGLLGRPTAAAAFAVPALSATTARTVAMAGGSVTSDFDLVRTTKEKFVDSLLALPGVHAVGVGMRSSSAGGPGRPVVKVFVERKLPSSSLPSGQRIPPRLPAHDDRGLSIPGVFVETDVHVGGPYAANANVAKVRPLVPGFSTGLKRNQSFGAGTIGAVLADAATAGVASPAPGTVPAQPLSASDLLNRGIPLFFLTASHVVTAPDPAAEDVLQPAVQDNGDPRTDIVGRPDRWTRFPQSNISGVDVIWADAAAVLLADTAIRASIQDIGLPSGELVLTKDQLDAGITLQKSGRTTSRTQGRLISLHTSVTQSLFMGDIRYLEQAIVEARDGTTIADTGDSGSLVLDDQRRAAGLLVGSANRAGEFSQMVVTPIRLAIGDLNHNTPGSTLSLGTANRQFVLVTRD